nr:iron chelate uptake ABC transporter family permease subunit [Azospirillum brasilense]
MCVAVSIGAYPVAPSELAALLWAKATKSVLPVPKAVETVIWDIRGPRVLAALLVGAGLAASGAAYQVAALQPAGLARHPRRLLGGARRRIWHLHLAAVARHAGHGLRWRAAGQPVGGQPHRPRRACAAGWRWRPCL